MSAGRDNSKGIWHYGGSESRRPGGKGGDHANWLCTGLGPSTDDRGIHSRLSCESWRHLASLTDVRPTLPSRILECLPPPFPAAVCNQPKGRARMAGW